MSKASLRQAGAVLRLMDEAEWGSELVKTFVENWGGIRGITEALHEGRLTPEQIKAVVEGRCEILPAAEPAVTDHPTHYSVTVDYSQTLEQMIAAGRYDTRNNHINKGNFPAKGTGRVELELHLVHLNKIARTDEVLDEMDRRNFRLATIAELLALGAKYPNLQRGFPVVALGSVWLRPFGRRSVACLCDLYDKRNLNLQWFEGLWSEGFRFLAVSK